jgi:ferric iron reductase protein FhuF
MDQIEPLLGRYQEIGLRTTPPADGVETLQADILRDRDALWATLERFREHVGTDDMRTVGVHWIGQYGYALLPPVTLAMSRAGIGLDASLENLTIVQPEGSPAQVMLRDIGGSVVYPERYPYGDPAEAFDHHLVTSPAELRQFVLSRLYGQNLTPLIETIREMTGVSKKVIWGQIAYECWLFYDSLVEADPSAYAPRLDEDRDAMFESLQAEWAGLPGPNPLYHPTKKVTTPDEDGQPETWDMRSACCLIYKVPGRHMCGACPLGLKEDQVEQKLSTRDERRAEMAGVGD